MPVSSADEFLQISIDAIKNQTFKGFVCHLLCRKLNDEELKCINRLISDDERFVLTQLNLDGIAFALNYGLNLVKTKYVARMDADDTCHPARFEKQLNFLEGNPNYVMVGCRVLMINEQGEKTMAPSQICRTKARCWSRKSRLRWRKLPKLSRPWKVV